ncbi:hypothetical protein STAS_21184 [Striga asiatica]|uniref:Uncharacterized protein n=1 Tax=Striga asiatica TaxID=4170 RepID=A0A5A7QK49_STRAF|nr:hypothetical protein STAS_21184 [Striga asiatica]
MYGESYPAAAQRSGPPSTAVIDQQYCLSYPVDLTIVRKMLTLSKGNFEVKDANGNLMFKVNGDKVLSGLNGRSVGVVQSMHSGSLVPAKRRNCSDANPPTPKHSLTEHMAYDDFEGRGSTPSPFAGRYCGWGSTSWANRRVDAMVEVDTLVQSTLRSGRHLSGSMHGLRSTIRPVGHWTTHGIWQVFRGESTKANDLLFSVKRPSILQMKTKLHVFLASNTAEELCDFKIESSWFERSCVVYLGNSNNIIAQMKKNCNARCILTGKDSFSVTVYPNIDYAFVVVLVVLLEEINTVRRGNSGGP